MTDPDFPPFYLAIFYPNIRNIAAMSTHTPESSSLQQSTVYLCGTCRQLVDWDAQSVMCEACDTWYHLACQAIPSNQYSLLGHSSVHWSCKACNSGNYTTTSPAMLYEDTIQISDDNSINTSEEVSIESLDDQQKPIHESSANQSMAKRVRGSICLIPQDQT